MCSGNGIRQPLDWMGNRVGRMFAARSRRGNRRSQRRVRQKLAHRTIVGGRHAVGDVRIIMLGDLLVAVAKFPGEMPVSVTAGAPGRGMAAVVAVVVQGRREGVGEQVGRQHEPDRNSAKNGHDEGLIRPTAADAATTTEPSRALGRGRFFGAREGCICKTIVNRRDRGVNSARPIAV